MKYALVSSLGLSLIFALATTTFADIPTQLISKNADPAALSDCTVVGQTSSGIVGNRTQHDILSLIFHFAAYNAAKTQIGGLEVPYVPSPALMGGQSVRFSMKIGDIPLFSGTAKDIAYQTCEVQTAIFTGEHIWKSGAPWNEALVAAAPPAETVPATDDAAPPGDANAGPTAALDGAPAGGRPSAPEFNILTHWTTSGNGVTFLHVRVNLHPAESVTTQASDFRLDVVSKSGGKETVYGLDGPAPTITRVNYTSTILSALARQTPPPNAVTSAVAVNAGEDLGAQKDVEIFAGDRVTEVVTFTVRPDTDVSDKAINDKTLQWLPPPPSNHP